MTTKYQARSISLPSRSHPNTAKVEEELNKMNKWASSFSSSSSVCDALSGLQDLYISIDELLQMGSTKQVLSNPQNKQWVDELLDCSMKLLDVCSLVKDMALETQHFVGVLHSAIRRKKGDSTIKTSVSAYICYRKKMKKEGKKLLTSIKKMIERCNSKSIMENSDYHLSSVIEVLRRACSTNGSVFESVLSFVMPNQKARGWSVVLKWVHKGAISCESNSGMNEFENVDVALSSLVVEEMKVEKLEMAQRRLRSLEMGAKEIEGCLDGVFRRLIKTRASLLNIISQ